MDPYIETFVRSIGIDCIGKESFQMDELNPDIISKAVFGEEKETVK